MNCAEFESILADYIDGTLPDAGRAAVEQHAASCPDCREFMAEVSGGISFLARVPQVEPPPELITRIAYLAPTGRTRDPFEKQSWAGSLLGRWLMPVLQPRFAMGMAMTILSFAMLKRCVGVEVKQIQPADLSPVRVWGGVEDKALRVKDQVVKYYDNLRIVYEIETHLRDLQEVTPEPSAPKSAGALRPGAPKSSNNNQKNGNGSGQPPRESKP